jgi:hypothetical protein
MSFKLPFYFALAYIFCFPAAVLAEPIAAMQQGDIRIVVYSDDCALKSVVSNLPKRATWTEKGQTFEGCAGGTEFGVLLFYFREDKTVAAVPMQAFQKLTGV